MGDTIFQLSENHHSITLIKELNSEFGEIIGDGYYRIPKNENKNNRLINILSSKGPITK